MSALAPSSIPVDYCSRIMYFLSGALFVTLQESDTGIPVFQMPNNNYRYTCVLNRMGAITSFLPVLTDTFHFLPYAREGETFRVGDTFGLLLVRHLDRLRCIDTGDIAEVDAVLLEFGDASYVSLQLLRCVSRLDVKYKARTRTMVSKVSDKFSVSKENRRKFVSAALTYFSQGDALWDWVEDTTPKTESISDIYARYKKMSKLQLEDIISVSPEYNQHWPYAFSTYSQLFGCDDFLYQRGKDFLTQLIFDQRLFKSIEIEILQIIIEYQLQRLSRPFSAGTPKHTFDDELRVILDDLLLSAAFPAVMGAYHPIIDLVADAVQVTNGAVNSAIELVSIVNRCKYVIPAAARRAIGNRLERTILRFSEAEVKDFIFKAEPLAIFTNDGEFQRLVRTAKSSKAGARQLWTATRRICDLANPF